MLNLVESRLTVYILASRREARYTQEFWIHTAAIRRPVRNITWVNPLYVEDMAESNAVVPAMPEPYVVIGCMSPGLVSELLGQPALREMVESARLRIPVIFSPCAWDQAPCPFQGLMPATHQAITSTSQRDSVFVEVVSQIRARLIDLS